MTIHKTFDEFWGDLLLVRFHEGSENFRRYNELRADMALAQVPAQTSPPRILDLGCGGGDVSLVLAERGAAVTGVDRIDSVMKAAQQKAGVRNVRFLCEDLRRLTLAADSFDAALLLGLVGLMSREDDAALFAHCREWLAPGGVVLVDAPREPTQAVHEWTREFPDGLLTFRSKYDAPARIMHIQPTFRTGDGDTIDLFDPYDRGRGADQPGVWRYLYSQAELTDALTRAGFTVKEAEHCSKDDHFLLVGCRGE